MSEVIDKDGSDRSISKLREMVIRGKNFREEYELEYFGETITLEIRPLKDKEYTQIIDKLDEMGELEEGEIDPDEIDEEEIEDDIDAEFVEVMRDVAKLGIDEDSVGETQEGINELVDEMVGGVSIDIGAEVMEITSNLQEAERFRRG